MHSDHALRRKRTVASSTSPPRGFDFSCHMRRVCEDMVGRLAELAHIDLAAVAIGFTQTRRKGAHGVHASLTPMRFEGGALVTCRGGRELTVQRLHNNAGGELLYLLSFALPRFLNCPFDEKLITICHELWHISPRFDGDLRRFRGRCYAHGGSRARFDAVAARLASRWLAMPPPARLLEPLHKDFAQLKRDYGSVHGIRIRTPKLLPLPPSSC